MNWSKKKNKRNEILQILFLFEKQFLHFFLIPQLFASIFCFHLPISIFFFESHYFIFSSNKIVFTDSLCKEFFTFFSSSSIFCLCFLFSSSNFFLKDHYFIKKKKTEFTDSLCEANFAFFSSSSIFCFSFLLSSSDFYFLLNNQYFIIKNK